MYNAYIYLSICICVYIYIYIYDARGGRATAETPATSTKRPLLSYVS